MNTRLSTAQWLTTDLPATRTQARLGALYRLLRRLLANPIGLAGLILVGLIVLMALLAPGLPLADPVSQSLGDRLLPPSSAHWLGTDTLGRDILARVVFGARPTLAIVFLVLVCCVPAGLLIGAAAGLWGGWLDAILMRIADVFMAFPRLILAISVAATLSSGLWTAVIAIAITGWPPYARVARAEVAAVRHAEFIQAARALGVSRTRLLLRHALPLCMPSALVRAALDAPGIVLIVSGLGFLGLGLPPPTPEWGAMVAEGRAIVLEAWWVSTLPGVLILLLSLGFNFLGDALRDIVDPGVK
ncbi:ABC transporter permease [Comamonas sp. J-3]|uniref:ABC transporter permease n=1 Tax=Comamonas trifloxystrobinivorans TaxID=3350256 RepID=UPI00372C67F3